MTWFRADDKLHAHRKAARAGTTAMGLWLMAGTWCADQLTDGFVPDYKLPSLAPDIDTTDAADRLVRAGLWLPGDHDGDTGWWFHQYLERNFSREQVLEEREKARDRMAKARKSKGQRALPGDDGSPDVRESSDDVRPNTSRTAGEVRVTPSRPVPTRTSYGSSGGAGLGTDNSPAREARDDEQPRGPAVPLDGRRLVWDEQHRDERRKRDRRRDQTGQRHDLGRVGA